MEKDSTSKSTSSLKKKNNSNASGRKRARRVTFAKIIETVHIVENLRLDLTADERVMVWDTPQNEATFIEQALAANWNLNAPRNEAEFIEQASAANFFGDDTSSPVINTRTNNDIFFGGDNPRTNNSNLNSKRRSRKGHGRRHRGIHSPEQSPMPLHPSEPLIKCSPMSIRSPLKSITSRLGLRKKGSQQLPFRNKMKESMNMYKAFTK
jgi:hypothetical protein